MRESIVAVLGTLLGSVTAYLLQQRAARTERAEARAESTRRDRLAAVTALADHRRAMWVREDLRLSGAEPDAYAAARAESHATRSAVTAPLTEVTILAPDLAPAAHAAARAAFALRGAEDADTLAALRQAAITAADELIAAAAGQL